MRIQDLPGDDELLTQHAEPSRSTREEKARADEWVLKGQGEYGFRRNREAMLALIKLCLLMDQPVRDEVSAEFMYEVVRRLAALEDQAIAPST